MKKLLLALLLLAIAVAAVPSRAQPLLNPYQFIMPDTLDVDTALLYATAETHERAGERGRIVARDGHFFDPDGNRFQIIGTTVLLSGCFPDSSTAILMARRIKALGFNTVQFMQFDYTYWQPACFLTVGNSTLGGGVDAENIKRLDWFTYQLKEQGVYSAFIFHSAWNGRPDDPIIQWDSTGWGARTTIYFDPGIQQIHRDMIRLLMEHENQYTGVAYKDEPALLYLMPFEDPSLTVYWLYTSDVVRPADGYTGSVGRKHFERMDSLYQVYLRGKGYTLDAQLNNAWKAPATNPQQQVRNGDFEDPFDVSAWTFFSNAADGAQAIMQFAETDQFRGKYSAKILIGNPGTSEASVYLTQTLSQALPRHTYRLSLRLKSSAENRSIRVYMYNGAFPYDALLYQGVDITNEWKEYTFDFVARTSGSDSPVLQLRLGLEAGDVFLDDITFNEVDIAGLRSGESIQNGSVQRLTFYDGNISEKRSKDQADFYMQYQEGLFESVRKLMQDTLGSGILLSPGRRMLDHRDRWAAREYDFFCYYDFRSAGMSFLEETGGSSIWVHTANNMANKPYVLSGLNYQFPRPYQSEVGLIMPAYAGLHDWDGVHVSYFSTRPTAGSAVSDSNSFWTIVDKPHVLTMVPMISNMMRRRDVAPSERTLQINNSNASLEYPQHHANQVYSLQNGADGRMGLFRRIVMNPELADEESFLPQLDISALAGDVDPSALDAENEQIFFDATRAVMRVVTPQTMAVAGMLEGKIVTEQDFIVEQVSAGTYTTVVLSSLTDSAIVSSPKNLLVIGSRGLNEGAAFNADQSELELWGTGPMMLEGRSVRVTVKAPAWDSCHITPLGADARPIANKRRSIGRSPSGRFSIAVETNADQSPWYTVEFSNIPTTVAEGGKGLEIRIAPNPATDGSFTVSHGEETALLEVVDRSGRVVRSIRPSGSSTAIDTNGMAAGVYLVRINGGEHGTQIVTVF